MVFRRGGPAARPQQDTRDLTWTGGGDGFRDLCRNPPEEQVGFTMSNELLH